MAKRRRLDVMPAPGPLDPGPLDSGTGGPAPTRPPIGPGLGSAPTRAPIGQVAGEAAALAALDEVSGVLRAAQDEGRMVLSLPLTAIAEDHLIRDRLEAEPEAMEALLQSLRARGQQTPVEVADLGSGRWGLISGWRRLVALRRLWEETGDDRFSRILALPRRSGSGAPAYVAMVEENEVRANLSFYERARIVLRAVGAGAFDSEKAALQTLFASASYAKRSKVKSFITIVEALDTDLRFPTHIAERQGLALSKALTTDSGLAGRIRATRIATPPDSPEAELKILAQTIEAPKPPPTEPKTGSDTAKQTLTDDQLRMRVSPGKVILEGPLDEAFVTHLRRWLSDEGYL